MEPWHLVGEDHQDHCFHCKFIFDKPRYICPKDHGAKVYELTHADDTKVTMTHQGILQPVETVDAPFQDLKKWKVSKHGMPELCPKDVAKVYLYHNAWQDLVLLSSKTSASWNLVA